MIHTGSEFVRWDLHSGFRPRKARLATESKTAPISLNLDMGLAVSSDSYPEAGTVPDYATTRLRHQAVGPAHQVESEQHQLRVGRVGFLTAEPRRTEVKSVCAFLEGRFNGLTGLVQPYQLVQGALRGAQGGNQDAPHYLPVHVGSPYGDLSERKPQQERNLRDGL